MYTRIYYRIIEESDWVDYLEVNGKDIDLSCNSDTLLTHGINLNSKILPAVNKVDIPKMDNKIKVPINLSNGKVYDLILDVSKDENISYYDVYIKSKELHIIYRVCFIKPGLTLESIRQEHAFVAQATKQGFYVINFDQKNNGYMYFMLDNDFNNCYKTEFSYTGNPLNFLCNFKKFTDIKDKSLVDYTSMMGVTAANTYRFIKGKDSIFTEYPIPFYIDNNELILCPELNCKETVTCFLDKNKPREYHYTITKED